MRLALAVVSLAAGILVGVAAVVVHGLRVGLVLALVATIATVLALPPGWARLPFAAGWMGVVLYVSNPRPEGDYLVAADLAGYLLLGTGMVIVAFAIVTVRGRPRPRATAVGADDGSTAADVS